ncbi:MAG: LapA family protein [Pseudomonadota bacterium]|nr:LapA family protein [Pseudomonadota bacterium]
MRWVWLTLGLLVVVVLTAFTLQNSSYRAPLQLDLWFAAWKLKSPVSVSALMWSSFGAGLLIAGAGLGFRGMRLGQRVRQLEQEIAMGSARGKDPWAGA